MTTPKIPDAPFALICATEFLAAADGDQKKLPRVKMVAYTGGPMRVGGWGPTPVIIALEGLTIPANVPLRFAHDSYELVGHSESVRVEGAKLLLDGVISFETPRARAIVAAAANGFPWQASVGVAPDEVKYIEANQTMDVNGATRKGPLYVVTRGGLREVSIVDLGADSKTRTQIAAMAAKDANVDETATINPTPPVSGGSPSTPVGVTAAAPAAPSSPARSTSTVDTIIDEQRAKQAQVERKNAMVRAAATEPGADLDAIHRIGTEAITANWTEQQLELALLKVGRAPSHVATHRGGGPTTDAVLACAMLMSCGMDHDRLVKDPDFGANVVEAAWKRSRGRMGLHQLIATVLQANGMHVGHGGEAVFNALVAAGPMLAMQNARAYGDINAGFSTVSLATILGTVGNKIVLDSFTQVGPTYQEIAQLADFNNFLTYNIVRLTASGGFQRLGSTGEIKHASLGEDAYTNRLDTRGIMLTLTRQQIVNDDMGAFQQIFRIFGRDAALALEEAVYDAFMESSDVFFTSARNNRITTNALSLAGLQAADAKLMGQTNENGKPIYAFGSRLIVPPALRATADSLYVSENIQSGNTSGQPEANTMRGRFKPVTSPFLGASSGLAGASDTAWYLACDPNILPFLQVAFLQGRRQPTVETSDAQFNQLGMSLRGFSDFGVATIDYRGANKNTP